MKTKITAPEGAVFAVQEEILTVNHKPHVFVVGPKHVEHASKYHGGMLGTATLDVVPCAYPRCGLLYAKHTYELALVVLVPEEYKADLNTVPGLRDWLVTLQPQLEEEKLAGVTFFPLPDEHKTTKDPNDGQAQDHKSQTEKTEGQETEGQKTDSGPAVY